MKPALHRHPIQLSILEDLRVASDGRRYSGMRPAEIENDLYNYHLQQLVRHDLVQKRGDKYFLTETGKKHIVELNPISPEGDSHRFKIASLCLLIDNAAGSPKVLYQRRTRQPFIGEWGIVGGGWQRGELAVDAAGRRLVEETGLSATFSLFGLIRKRHFDPDGQLYSDILFHVCIASSYQGDLVPKNDFGEQIWVSLDQAITIESRGLIGSPQFAQILQRLKSIKPSAVPLFYLEETYTQDIY
jgi:ADP-ribose pyrophosphatase YjhB (NUDIX family)